MVFWTIHIYDYTVCVGQALGYDSAGYSASGFHIGCNPGVGQGYSHFKAPLGKDPLHSSFLLVGFRFQQAAGLSGRLPSTPWHMDLSVAAYNMPAGIIKVSKWEIASSTGVTDFYNLILEVLFHHFSCIH